MLEKIFSYDNTIFRIIVRFGKIWLLNILWLLFSLPIVTIGAASTALIYSCMKLKNEDGNVFKYFFSSFKENFWQGNILGLIYFFIGTILTLDVIYWNHADKTAVKIFWAVAIALLFLYIISLLYVFAIQSKFVNSIWKTIVYSFLMAIYNIKHTIAIVIIVGIFIYINLTTIFLVNFLSINFGIGILFYVLASFYDKAFKKFYK